MVKICVFDTETTGLPPYLPGKDWSERNANEAKLLDYSDLGKSSPMWEQILHLWSSIIQFSYIIYDLETPNNSKIFNKYIIIPENVIIEESSIKIHHIDREKIQNEPAEKKALIRDVISEFMRDIMDKDVVTIVGHNVQFDRKMIIAELLRLSRDNRNAESENWLKFLMNNDNFTCTMCVTAPICNIQIAVNYKDKKTGQDKVFYKVKDPKLIESYQYYFGYSPDADSLHDALIDVILCLCIFMKYKYNEDICGKNEIITSYISKLNKFPTAATDLELENIKLEIIELFSVSEKETERKTKTKTKREKNDIKGKKTKRRRSKRILALLQKYKRNI